MKKLIFSLVLLVGFALSTMTIESSFAQDAITHVDNEGSGSGSGEVIKCFCYAYTDGTVKCKAQNSNHKPTGDGACAQSKPGGNVKCWEYDGNCNF